jgi:phosphoribosylformylglycinamidine cyclo-ligase
LSKLYKKSGVDVIKTDKLISQALKFIKSSHNDKVLGNKLGFSAEYRVSKDVTLCAATDGVGTKAILAAELNDYIGIGQDLVAMCSNDLLCNKAKPLFFLDYFACSSVKSKQYTEILRSITGACKKINCSLIGGETAEMPSLYKGNHFDIAGFLIGIKKRYKTLNVTRGDLIFGIKSNGFHSNGFSLIRKIISKNKINIKRAKFNKQKLSNLIMRPTRLYHRYINDYDLKHIKTLSHITGGGVYSNFKRSIPKGTKFDLNIIKLPKEYDFIKDNINISNLELMEIFNCGIGMIFVINKKHYKRFIKRNLFSLIGEIK